MACPISSEEVAKLKMFIGFASAQPQILNLPQLDFFKSFVEQLGGKVPPFSDSRLDVNDMQPIRNFIVVLLQCEGGSQG